MLQRGRSMNSLRVFADQLQLVCVTVTATHGAMMILAPGTGSSLPSIEAGTWASQSSSSEESVEALEEYHEPAWLATRVVAISEDGLRWNGVVRFLWFVLRGEGGVVVDVEAARGWLGLCTRLKMISGQILLQLQSTMLKSSVS